MPRICFHVSCAITLTGIKVTYALDKMRVARVHRVFVRCSECPTPEYHPLEGNKEYGLLVNSFLLNGGDGYSMFQHRNGTKVFYLGALTVSVRVVLRLGGPGA